MKWAQGPGTALHDPLLDGKALHLPVLRGGVEVDDPAVLGEAVSDTAFPVFPAFPLLSSGGW